MPHAGVCFVCFAHYLQTEKHNTAYAVFMSIRPSKMSIRHKPIDDN